MALKRMADPDTVLLLWKAGLVVNSGGGAWMVYPGMKRDNQSDLDHVKGILRKWSAEANVIVEDE